MKKLSMVLLATAALSVPAFAQTPTATPPAPAANGGAQNGQKYQEHFEDRQKAEQEMFQKRQAIEQKYFQKRQELFQQEHAEMEQLYAEMRRNHPGMGEHMGGGEGGGMNGGQGGPGMMHPGAAPGGAAPTTNAGH